MRNHVLASSSPYRVRTRTVWMAVPAWRQATNASRKPHLTQTGGRRKRREISTTFKSDPTLPTLVDLQSPAPVSLISAAAGPFYAASPTTFCDAPFFRLNFEFALCLRSLSVQPRHRSSFPPPRHNRVPLELRCWSPTKPLNLSLRRTSSESIESPEPHCISSEAAAMTGRSRRGVKFPHKHSSSNGPSSADGRRSSFSDVSEEGSPTKTRSSMRLDNIAEVRAPKIPRS